MGNPDELVDEVDEPDRVIRVVSRAEMRRENLRHRGVAILVVNSSGEILIHRRAEDKDVWPGMWDLAAGGVVAAGETYAQAAARELAEELGIHGAPLRFLTSGRYEDDTVRVLSRVFLATWDGPVHFADGEVIEALFVTRDELSIRLATDAFVMDSATMAAEFLFPGEPG